MKKLGIILDAFSCLTKEQADNLGYYFLPLQVEIDGVTYLDGIDDRKELLEKIAKAQKTLTSLPKLETIEQVLTQASKENDAVIFLGISSKLSATANTVRSLGSELGNIHVMENHLIGDQITQTANYLKHLYETKNYTINQLYEELTWINESAITYIVPENVDHMIKGGRLSSFKKFVLTKIPMLPILSYEEDGSVKLSSLKRNLSKAIQKTIEHIVEFCDEQSTKFKDSKFVITFIHGIKQELIDIVHNNKYFKINPKSIFLTPSVIAVHTGPEAIALGVMPELKIDHE
ncbi:fatty acid-binding protein DegV [Mycoplasmopsis bovirhinis]|uniref:DegV family protein n=1 Tax=Mycoplasmopsis bovirhinis TaxID=29553 RepID=UPI000C0595E0|nr:DegV family protein [Mycoplasmopsis bovirhinis]ATO30922.1 fatty acid-binding protein DegV [Mycoplasmopsis bovirhinis]